MWGFGGPGVAVGGAAGCLDRDLFQYERQRATVRGLLLLVPTGVLAALAPTGRVLSAGTIHQN